MRKKIFLLVFGCLAFLRQYAQTSDYVFSHLDFTNGLCNNHVTSIYKDTRGFMWFGTVAGLNRYDGNQFRLFKHDQRDTGSIADNYIEQMFEGPGGRLWVEIRAGRFNIFDFGKDRFDQDCTPYLRSLSLPVFGLLRIVKGRPNSDYWFVYKDSGVFHYPPSGKIVPLHNNPKNPINSASTDGDGNLWIVYRNGILEKIDGQTNKVAFRTDIFQKSVGDNLSICNMYIDRQNDLWLYSNGVFKGAYYYCPSTKEFRHLAQESPDGALSSNVVVDALQDEKGLIWLATDHGGINIVDKRNFSVKYIRHAEDDAKSVVDNSLSIMYRDSSGTIWLGTFKNGVSYYHQNRMQFPQYRHEPMNPGSLSYDDVNSFAEDSTGNCWLGSNGGGLISFDRKRNRFRQYLHAPNNPNSLSNNIIVSLSAGRNNQLWIGTYFGGLDCYDGKTFTHYKHDDHNPNSLSDDRVMCVYEDSDGQLWIGTLAGGMDRLDRRKKQFVHYNFNLPNSISNNYVSSIMEDDQKNLWIATGYGIDVLQKKTGRFMYLFSSTNQLSSDNVTTLLQDSRHHIWAGTREGLDLYDPKKNSFQSFRTEDGLPDNTIRSIQEDKQHNLWVATANGISKITLEPRADSSPYTIHCKNFHEQDGLQGREFNERAGLAIRDGSILLGGPNGFNIFDPSSITGTRNDAPIVLSQLELFDHQLHPGEQTGGHVILEKALSETGQITLHYNEKVFSIGFASLDYVMNTRGRYMYMLEGFDKNWLTTDANTRKATFTNLDAGHYVFRVKASDEDGVWSNNEASLSITILPPWWKTPLAYIIYGLLTLSLLYFARRLIIQRARTRFALENERKEARRMHEIDMMKIRFFTNMSHELRTPLSLILAPVEKLLSHAKQPEPAKQYQVIHRNARRLLHLVNQLLDFRKLEVNELRLHAQQGDILQFIRDISFSFIDLAERKNISFHYHADPTSLVTVFDHDKLERILFNLLSNAFKFTPESGSVTVEVQAAQSPLQIKIKDTGIGIAPEMQQRIFERFFQTEVPASILNQGSGIGLAITMEFVKMHNGTLTVESQLNQGSCFTVTLPFTPVTTLQPQPTSNPIPNIPVPEITENTPVVPPPNGKKKVILLVEDNEDFRFYLKDNLRDIYTIHEAGDGQEGWRKTLALHPDLVVSDISMPLMNGIDLCRKIKSDERTRQLPVILLTALAGERTELESLDTGATDFIAKPFNFEVLLSRVRNVLAHNDLVKKTYQRQVQALPATIEPVSADEAFLQNVLELIEKNMDDPDFSVTKLGEQFHTSRSTFYKRLLLLTGKTPVEFIRHIRLKRAAELLEKSQLSVSEIAYSVGFNDPKYFAQNFKMEYDVVPSVYRAQKKK